jgi:hypothetical protein
VAARITELVVLRKIHPVVSARIAASLHPIGAVILVAVGPPVVFVLLHGAGNGLLTIAQGRVALAIARPTNGPTRMPRAVDGSL